MADDTFVSLYRRFRPGRFDELVGQDHVARALRSAVRDDRVIHAYLFSGPRGTGKTSSARILAKALNCESPSDGEPCGVCTSCREIAQGNSLNVHELDAASNNGVDAMRDLVAHAGLGTPGRWKVYIVDEVHMLSTAAANALLKTLEEPPGHVVFVLATTDPQKVPPTIRSRTQHLEFRLLGAEVLQSLLESVSEAAALGVDERSIEVAVRRGRGSARDALSALDQLVASGSADAGRPELASVVDALAQAQASDVLVALSALLAGGWGPQQLATELVDDLRQVFLAVLAPDLCAVPGRSRERYEALAETMKLPRVVRTMELLGKGLVDMRDAPDAQVVLEIALVRAARPDLDAGVEALAERVSALERQIASGGVMAAAPPPPPGAPAGAAEARPTPEHMPAVEVSDAEGARAALRRERPEVTRPGVSSAPETPAPPPPVEGASDGGERRPSLGAIRRRQASEQAGRDGDALDPAPAPEVEVRPPAQSEPPATAPPSSPRAVDRDALTEAWGDGVLRSLPAKVKALYSAGRFVAFDETGAHFALPTQPHRDRCAELAPQVEAALAAHFGTPVSMTLVVDESGPAPVSHSREGGSRDSVSRRARQAAADDDMEDPEELIAATQGDTDVQAVAEAKLLEAFPGAEVS